MQQICTSGSMSGGAETEPWRGLRHRHYGESRRPQLPPRLKPPRRPKRRHSSEAGPPQKLPALWPALAPPRGQAPEEVAVPVARRRPPQAQVRFFLE